MTLSGSNAEVLGWSENVIRVRLPQDFPAGEGTARVTVAGQKSNDLRILGPAPAACGQSAHPGRWGCKWPRSIQKSSGLWTPMPPA